MSSSRLSAAEFQSVVQTLSERAPGQEKFHLHGRLLRLPTRQEARELVELDPELAAPEHARLRAHLTARYRERLEMFGVG